MKKRKPSDPKQVAQQQATASREKVREMARPVRAARQSQRPVERNARRRAGA